MSTRHARIRSSEEIPVAHGAGLTCRRYLGPLSGAGEAELSGTLRSVGDLCVFDVLVVDANGHTALESTDGLEILVYVLDGRCRISGCGDTHRDVDTDEVAHASLGRGARLELHNLSSSAPLRLAIAGLGGVAASRTAFDVAPFPHAGPGIVWFASSRTDDQAEGSIALELPARMGIATLAPGVDRIIQKGIDRSLYAVVAEGYIELGPGFVEEGGDACSSLRSNVRLQGVKHSRVFVMDLPTGFAQELG